MMRPRFRIAIGGIHIESSTFTVQTTPLEDFAVRRGQELLDAFPVAEWLGAERASSIEWVPTLHAITGASGPVDPETYDALEDELIATLAAHGPYDGVYIPFHGAMSVAGRQRAEEHLVRRIRETVGEGAILSASMDPHGNMSRDLAELLDLAACHRHAPHIDNVQTRERAVVHLVEALERGRRPAKAWLPVPVLLPGERTSTTVEPGATVFGAQLSAIARHGVVDAGIWIGFAWADEERCGAAVLVTGEHEDAALACAEELGRTYWDARDGFSIVMPHGSFEEALGIVEAGGPFPVIVSDSGDNVTAGASGDITYAAHAVRRWQGFLAAHRTLIAGLVDPPAVEAALDAGVGAVLSGGIGAGEDARFGDQLPGPWRVESLLGEGESVTGALLSQGMLHVSVQRVRDPFIAPDDPAFPAGVTRGLAFLELDGYDLVVVKNGYQFPSQTARAAQAFLALTPGGTDLDFPRLPIRHWTRPMYPLDRDFTATLTPVLLRSAG